MLFILKKNNELISQAIIIPYGPFTFTGIEIKIELSIKTLIKIHDKY